MAVTEVLETSYPELASTFRALRDQYESAEPFPHIVLGKIFDSDLLKRVAAEFPAPRAMGNEYLRKDEFAKYSENRWEQLQPETKLIFAELQSAPFLACMSELTGIEDLISDPTLAGGGQHQIADGGYLNIHADFNKHPRYGLDRRLNLLLYLNEQWKTEWNGQLELWDTGMTRCVEKVPPVLGTVVIFSTTSTSYHGHPEPLRLPPGVRRKSLALYYYTNGRPEDEAGAAHSTLFQQRPGFRDQSAHDLRAKVRIAANRWCPPVIKEKALKVRDRLSHA